MNRQAWLWLGLGIFLRLLVIGQPPEDDNSWIRQTQTADAIQSWIAQGHPSWDAAVSWRGDTGARSAMELPLYNVIVYGGSVAGIPFAIASREVLILLWVDGRCLVMAAYLGGPDETLRQTTLWMRENNPVGNLVIIKANHSVYTRKYPQLPGFSYLSGRRTWIWSPYLSDEEQAPALKTSRWLVEALPYSRRSWRENIRKQIKGHERPVEDISELKKTVGAELVTLGDGYRVFQTTPSK